jgi:cytoskeletal protein RodZ
MGIVRLFLWTAAAVALGIFLATYKIGGHTPLETAERTWHQTLTPQRVSAVKEKVEDAYEDAKDKVSTSKAPHEHHSTEDRDAVNKLIAKRSPKK